jgi:hypothetical protein
MVDLCSICYEHMDMKTFKDPNTTTSTCVKLECEHAYHTTCIIGVLNKTNAQCPLCGKNKVSDEITREGLLKKIFSSAKRNPEIKQSIQEFKESFSSYKELIKQLKIETEEFIINRMKETNFKQNRTYLIKTMDNVRSGVRRYAKSMGPQYVGALAPGVNSQYWLKRRINTELFGLRAWRNYNIINYPVLRIRMNSILKKI